MKFGVRLPNSGSFASADNLKHFADAAVSVEYDSIWVHDHILWSTTQATLHPTTGNASIKVNTNFFESVTLLSYLAGRYDKIKLGVAAIILPLRNPVILAKQLANVDVLSDSRLLVGVVPGAPNITIPEFEALGVSYHERGKITDEYIQVLRTIWSQHPASFEGKYVKFKNIEILPKPKNGTISILIGGGEKGISERALQRVIQYGDGWVPAYLTPDELKKGIEAIETGFKRNGKNGKPLVVHEMYLCIADSKEEAMEICKDNFASTFGDVGEGEKRSLVGSVRDVMSKLEYYSNLPLDTVELKVISKSFDHMLRTAYVFAREIAPSFT